MNPLHFNLLTTNAVGFALLFVGLAGCADDDLETTYGHRGGLDGAQSVNGTAVLSDLVAAAGYRVETRRTLTPGVRSADAIVWFPDDFAAPSDEVSDWFDEWLAEGVGRTLVYVGRDFDAAPLYWRKIQPLVPAADRKQAATRLTAAERVFQVLRSGPPETSECYWFDIDKKLRRRDVRELSGKWSAGVDEKRVEISLHGRLTAGDWANPLLESGDDILVSRVTDDDWDGGQIIVVANGSFLLNLPLVNHEHRKLAGHLVESLGLANRVVFLESESGGPEILDRDPSPGMSTGLEILKVWPINVILLHLAVLGIIFCFARFPIFGTPRQPAGEPASDFGRHVDALGELLARTGDQDHALAKLMHYRDVTAPRSRGG